MAKNLVIVESPAKAKTIAGYLGKDYEVTSSYGHIRDLPKKGMSIDIAKNFEPTYDIPEDKQKTVRDLKKMAKGAQVWLATDEDREGEAIAWHLCKTLGLDEKSTKRIVFHEITKPAIENAVANPRTLDLNLVDAQQARRVLDRLVGYELSPVLWKKVQRGLSAGRVQSVAVRLIVEREKEIKGFTPVASFKVTAILETLKKQPFNAELSDQFETKAAAKSFLELAAKSELSIASLITKPATKNPSPPFTTSTLQQAASRLLGFSVRQTMVVAQQLYEAGHITYMRTDSLNLSETAIKQAAVQIEKQFGADFVETRHYKTKSAGAQEAHEAIRPTHFDKTSLEGEATQQKLYQLIWRRAMASQMKAASLERTEARISVGKAKEQLIAKGEMIQFEGWLKVYAKATDQTDETILPPLSEGEKVNLKHLQAAETFSRAKPRYSEASLVKKLEALGIGRPSTYAPTISTIQTRKYIEKRDSEGEERSSSLLELTGGKVVEKTVTTLVGTDRSKLFPTDIGEVVTNFLVKYFPSVVDYDFTAKSEAEFDKIAEGKESWNRMIKEFYQDFHKLVVASEKITRKEAIQARQLGKDPKTNKPIIARIGRFGPMVQIGEAEDEEKPRFAAIPEGKRMDSITLEEALELFNLPRKIGETEKGEAIEANFGRFGPYIKVGSLYVSIKPDDPYSITEKRAKELYKDKLEKEAKKEIQKFEGSKIRVLNGPYGPYITDGTKNAPIPDDKKPEKLTLKECEEMLKNAPAKRFRRRTKKT